MSAHITHLHAGKDAHKEIQDGNDAIHERNRDLDEVLLAACSTKEELALFASRPSTPRP